MELLDEFLKKIGMTEEVVRVIKESQTCKRLEKEWSELKDPKKRGKKAAFLINWFTKKYLSSLIEIAATGKSGVLKKDLKKIIEGGNALSDEDLDALLIVAIFVYCAEAEGRKKQRKIEKEEK